MEIQVLGPVELRDNGAEVPVGGPRQRRLLAALVVNAGKVVSVERLIDAVWAGEEPPERAARTLHTYLSRLRAALGDGLIQKRDPGYSLVVDPEMVDATRFERLLAAAHSRAEAGDATQGEGSARRKPCPCGTGRPTTSSRPSPGCGRKRPDSKSFGSARV